METTVRVSLLGPFEVRAEGRVTAVAGVKLQSLLAQLALAVPHAVSDDRLVEELWGDDQPANPANALQALVSHLRRLLGRDAVARLGAGYVLRLDPDLIDAVRLERLVEQARAASARGDHGAAAATFREAIGLVHGPPLGGLLDSWFARDAAARLDELVQAAHEGLVDSELALGRHADVVAGLVDLVARHPLRERFRAQLMIALYRSGRQADALQAYRDARQYLLDELGLDPGPELRALERSVLSATIRSLAAPIELTPSASIAPGAADPADVVRRPLAGAGEARGSRDDVAADVGRRPRRRRQDPTGAGAGPPARRAGRGLVRRAGTGDAAVGGRRGGRRRRRRAGARPG